MDMEACIHTAAEVIRSRSSLQPQVGLILGSGLGDFCDGLQNAVKIPFSELPAFPQATVEGHCGEFWIGTHQQIPVLALRGRLHYYEGYTAPQISTILHKNVNTIYTLLARSKKILRERLGGE